MTYFLLVPMHHEVEVLVMAMLWMVGLCCSIDKYVLDLLVCDGSMLEHLCWNMLWHFVNSRNCCDGIKMLECK